MRVIEINNAGLNIFGTVKIPDSVVYVFNPNYVEINFGEYSESLYLSISDGIEAYKIEVNLYNGVGKSYISKIMQYYFTEYVSTRSKELDIKLEDQNGHEIMSESVLALWASLSLGMKFGYYLPFSYGENESQKNIREVIWFKNFPFRVSLFCKSQVSEAYGKSDHDAEKPIISAGENVWVPYSGSPRANARKSARVINGETPAQTIQRVYATEYIDLGLLSEAGYVVDLNETGVIDTAELSEVPLEDVVLRKRGNAVNSSPMDWSDYVESQLDIVSYLSLSEGMAGIFELSPLSMFPDTRKRLTYTIMNPDIEPNAIFDANFDITFDAITEVAYVVKLIVDNSQEGIYLRWIDHYGFWQYFLFNNGTSTNKNTLNNTVINTEYESNGLYHTYSRSIHVDNEESVKCCAVNLKKEILAYVKTISKSPYIEMFLGYDKEQNEMWLPVNIIGETTKIESNKKLYDYEFSIKTPDIISQTI